MNFRIWKKVVTSCGTEMEKSRSASLAQVLGMEKAWVLLVEEWDSLDVLVAAWTSSREAGHLASAEWADRDCFALCTSQVASGALSELARRGHTFCTNFINTSNQYLKLQKVCTAAKYYHIKLRQPLPEVHHLLLVYWLWPSLRLVANASRSYPDLNLQQPVNNNAKHDIGWSLFCRNKNSWAFIGNFDGRVSRV